MKHNHQKKHPPVKQVVALSLRAGGRNIQQDHTVEMPATESALYALYEAVEKLEKALGAPRFFRAVLFGSARVLEGDPHYEATRELARRLSEQCIDVVTGGGPGIMEAAARGSVEGARRRRPPISVGVCIDGLKGRHEPPNKYLKRAYRHGNFFTRLHQFARLGASGTFVILPGGVGTLLEFSAIWQLRQVGHLGTCPLIIADPMWHDVIETMRRHAVPRGYISENEIDENVQIVSSALDALPIILEAHQRFKKMRAAG